MNEKNIILNYEEVFNTYKTKIPNKQLYTLEKRNWLPIKSDSNLLKEYSYLIAKILGDGHLDNNYTCKFIGQKEDIILLSKLIIENTKIERKKLKIKKRVAKGTSYLLQVNDCLFGRLLYALGAPKGNKTKVPFLIPNWVFTSKEISKEFLRGLFDDELSTIKIKRNKYFREPTFRMVKVKDLQENLLCFLNQIKTLTEKFSVKCSKISDPYYEYQQKSGKETYSRCFRILGNKNNILRFRSNIGFKLNISKIDYLNKSISEIIK